MSGEDLQFPPLSRLAIGCELLGGTDWGSVDLPKVRDAIRCALEAGVTVFDTADIYGLGHSEVELSSVLGTDRHDVTIVTKGGVRWSDVPSRGRATTMRDVSYAYLSSAIDASLRRLRLDVIPIYLVHWPDLKTPLEETIACLEAARVAGKIQKYGLSNFSCEEVETANKLGSISAVQAELHVLSPESQSVFLAFAKELGLETLSYGPLAQGLLSGKYARGRDFDSSDRRHRLDHFKAGAYARNQVVMDALIQISDEVGRPPAQVAIRWVLETGVTTSVVMGARTREQVLENYDTLAWSLDQSHIQVLNQARRVAGLVDELELDSGLQT
jgi:aryl-alcohol dehydrogenase-like predicted oxidoreductase